MSTLSPEVHERLVEAARLVAVGRLVPSVAHQLSTPLASIALRAESLERTVEALGDAGPSAKLHRHIKAILGEIGQCKEVLSTLQDFARPPRPASDGVDLNALGRGGALLIRHEAMRRQAHVELRFAAALPRVRGEEGRLGQVVLAFLLNALEASPPGKPITLETRADGEDRVALVVSDEGEGVPEAHRERLFEPFSSTRPAHAGVGLGLMACRAIAAAHGGSVVWESAPGRGSRFVLTLPVAGPVSGSGDTG